VLGSASAGKVEGYIFCTYIQQAVNL